MIKRRDETKVVGNYQVTVWLHTGEFIIVCFTNTKKGAKTASREPKLSYFDGRAQRLSARVNHGMPAAGVISHMHGNSVKNYKIGVLSSPGRI